MIVAEFKVVADEVDAHFGPDENVMEWIKLQPDAHISQQMVAAYKIGAGEGAAGNEVLIEANALAAKSTEQFKRSSLPQRWRIDRIEVVKDRTEGGEPVREVLSRAP